jgi:LysR family transcriptional regulator, regulator for metE and metH
VHLEIRHLRLVTAIAEAGSVTQAGNRLHLTQSALSHQLRDAEEQLGAPLFERRKGKMLLTPAGERLLQTAKTVLTELERAHSDIQKGDGDPPGLIRLSTQCYTVYYWLPPLLKLFQKKFPAVDFQLVVEATDNPIKALLEGTLDVAIACTPIRNRKIVYTPLFEDELLINVAPGHRLAGRKYVEPKDLAEETVIIYPPKEESTVLMEVLAPAGVTPHKVREVTLTEAAIELVGGGFGVAALPHWAVAPQLASGAIIGIPLTAKGVHRTWYAAQMRDNRSPEHLREFIRLLEERPISSGYDKRRVSPKKRPILRGSGETAGDALSACC